MAQTTLDLSSLAWEYVDQIRKLGHRTSLSFWYKGADGTATDMSDQVLRIANLIAGKGGGELVIPRGNYFFKTNLTMPASVSIYSEGELTAENCTVTFSGGFDAPRQQMLKTSGSGKFVLDQPILPEWLGGTVEATASISGNTDQLNTVANIIRITSSDTSPTIRGMLEGRLGQMVTIINNTANAITVNRDDTNASENDRIYMEDSTHIIGATYGSASFVYGANNRWWLMGNNKAVPAGIWTQSGSDIYYNDGNVGINDSTPTEKLTVGGGILIGTSGQTADGTAEWNGTNYRVRSGGAWWNQDIWAQSGADVYYDVASGRIGIGTTTPQSALEVRPDVASGHDGLRVYSDAGVLMLETDGTRVRLNRPLAVNRIASTTITGNEDAFPSATWGVIQITTANFSGNTPPTVRGITAAVSSDTGQYLEVVNIAGRSVKFLSESAAVTASLQIRASHDFWLDSGDSALFHYSQSKWDLISGGSSDWNNSRQLITVDGDTTPSYSGILKITSAINTPRILGIDPAGQGVHEGTKCVIHNIGAASVDLVHGSGAAPVNAQLSLPNSADLTLTDIRTATFEAIADITTNQLEGWRLLSATVAMP